MGGITKFGDKFVTFDPRAPIRTITIVTTTITSTTITRVIMDKMAKYSVSEKELTVVEVGLVTNCLLLIRWALNNVDHYDDIFTMMLFSSQQFDLKL